MKKIISILFATCLFLASCNNEEEVYYYDMYLAIEVVDAQGNDLLGESSNLIHQGETKVKIGNSYYYLDSQNNGNNSFTFRHIQNETNNYLKIGCWYYDRKDLYLVIDWKEDIKKDVIVFSYDSHLNGMESSSHDFRYPYSIKINGKDLELNEDTGHYIYVKDIE